MENVGIGPYIKNLRDRRGMTQRQLAELADTSSAYISQIEGGKVAWPGADMRRRLARALNVHHLDLIVAAGEITPDEISLAGVHMDTDTPPESDIAMLNHMIATEDLTEREAGELLSYLDFIRTKPAR